MVTRREIENEVAFFQELIRMAKTEPKPMYPLKHEFYASLDHVLATATMLADVTDQALKTPGVITNAGAAKILRERVTAFRKAMGYDE